jgi:phenylalanyl-tRNA synthetase beta chain
MKVTLSWLQEFAPLQGDPVAIAEQLSDLGLVVEEQFDIGGHLDGVVVARVLDLRPHPDADKIQLVDVDRGDGQALQIACGAFNMAVGDLVPLATVGTVMPGGVEIAARRMRGEMSNGMLCSARELELGDDHGGIMVLPGELQPGTPLTDALGLVADTVYDLDVLPNRPDALSVAGVARDLAARQGVPFAIPDPEVEEAGSDAGGLAQVEILDPDLCGRFVLRVLSGVSLGPSPRWMAQRLLAAGMRPINNVVDVSNYVMLELGQPNHTYDLAKVPGGVLRVRRARDGEQLETLDGVTRTLAAADGVIVDRDDRPVGLAGVMGGASTEISDSTTDVLVEMAWWDPLTVAATAARLNLHSEASLRFKRGTDLRVAPLAARRFAQLLGIVGGATLHPGVVDATGNLPEPAMVRVRPGRVNAVLGTELDRGLMVDLLDPIGFTSTPVGDDLEVSVPSWRGDSSTEIDVVEEIGRMYGFSRIPRSVPVSAHPGGLSPRQLARRGLRAALLGFGVSEAMPMPFLAPGDLERCGLPADGLVLANPLDAQESVLRTSLLPGLLGAVAYNASHRRPGVWLSEIGRVFGLGERGVVGDVVASELLGRVLDGEREHLGVALAGAEAPVTVELLDVVLDALGVGPVALRPEELPGLHPGRAAVVEVAGVAVGQVGEVDPIVLDRWGVDQRVGWLQLDLDGLLDIPVAVAHGRPISRFPSTDIDLAFVVGASTPAAAVRSTIRAAGGDLVRRVDLFDVFRSESLGEGRRSLAFRLRFQAEDRTLTDAEVGQVREAVIGEVESTHGATLRA